MTAQMALQFDTRGITAEMTKNAPTDLRQVSERASSAHLRPAIGSNQCKCYQCGECFSSVSVFDLHQRLDNGRVICIHPLDILARDGSPKPLVQNARGWWVSRLREDGAFAKETTE